MPRVHSQKAKADIYSQGKMIPDPKTKSGKRLDRSQPANNKDVVIVKKGQTYYWWKFRYGGKHISTTPPKPSQLTQSEFYSTLYDIEDAYSTAVAAAESFSDLLAAKDEAVSSLETLRDEQEEKKSNMPDSLQESPTGELLQERYDSVDSIITELEALDIPDDEDDDDDEREEDEDGNTLDDKREELSGIDFAA